jgi:KUP system potassium uptake protein
MLMTAAGTVKAARVVILGVGVAGLQAIATAKRLGAVIEASDVRPSVKEQVESLGANFWRLTARFGFMEQPDIPALIAASRAHGCTLHFEDVTYYLGRETVLHRTDGHGMPLWREAIFAFMVRNSAQPTAYFRLPREGVVEIGRQLEI